MEGYLFECLMMRVLVDKCYSTVAISKEGVFAMLSWPLARFNPRSTLGARNSITQFPLSHAAASGRG